MGVGKGKTLIYSICFMKICNNEYIALVFFYVVWENNLIIFCICTHTAVYSFENAFPCITHFIISFIFIMIS